ncbi:aspartate aminotransferase family protein [Effusibacillus lacus]|uniref:Aspartate aminotransferase family protein n=1 Tax=Effusibacillus lacus TaxID=1348429 RepID=A0A292YE42_9BACL|nr:aspartate aminotransferase family protein [Effusibacillus lacus]TCS75723.1 glutamate-1-semialdehyde 2,1-aminomutase [Effusibacillus lacus]GAX91042.1 aspartate aminotransferase family protein [Effusibacillus lacus]
MNLSSLQAQYSAKRTKSASFFKEADSVIAGGVNGNLRFFQPFPMTFQKAYGAWLVDLDGNHYVDYLLSYGSLLLGHGHSVVRQALEQVWEDQGTSSFGATHPLELEMSKEIKELYPGFERLRFTNSGLEATLFALRLALAFTGKTHIAKFEGHYHGSHDHVLVSVNPELNQAGSPETPQAVPESYGIPDYYLQHTIILPFNDWPACERILTSMKERIGAVILEPMQAGYIAADPRFVVNLRDLTEKLGMVLIFDEVKTGFRVSLGGAQAFYGVQPDLTALGKVVGGGFPIGVVGGKQEILDMCSPGRSPKREEVVFHSGTFNGNPVSLAAGLATIRYLKQPGKFESIVNRTNELRKGIESLAQSFEVPIRTIGAGTIFNVLAIEGDVSNYRDLSRNRKDWRLALDYLLMDNGVYSKPLNRFSMSDAHGPKEIQATLEAFEKSFAAFKATVHV